ncbi:MAG: acetyl-CoA carboxylase biotin carboxyl carrier protein subunit [Bacteroidetes bacterium HGW-Bacteroidetes-17]|jgi:biotin carboxyl carrier protein|nr:MAG: acetyl-CoA carboxylase biotin carboxyl carrier protein subunit [Bacteroidetes bacterium HGW-Bacteroidetes-17]
MEEKEPEYKTLTVDGVNYRTLLTKKYVARKNFKEVDQRMVSAFISGSINKIEVKKGKKVKAGDVLLYLEAMKMNNVIRAANDGVVKKIYVVLGEQVTKGQLLVEIV